VGGEEPDAGVGHATGRAPERCRVQGGDVQSNDTRAVQELWCPEGVLRGDAQLVSVGHERVARVHQARVGCGAPREFENDSLWRDHPDRAIHKESPRDRKVGYEAFGDLVEAMGQASLEHAPIDRGGCIEVIRARA